MNIAKLLTLFLSLFLPTICFAVSPSQIETGQEVMTYEMQRNQGLSVSGNYDAFSAGTVAIVSGTTSDGTKAQKLNISTSLKTDTQLKSVILYTDADAYFRLIGTGINAAVTGAGADSTDKFCLRAGKSITIEASVLSALTFWPNGTSAYTVDYLICAARTKSATPAQ